MARRDNTYSRVVAWLKILLPMAALALLSTLFLLSRGVGPKNVVPFSQAELKDITEERRVTAPFYAGTTSNGTSMRISASTARPDPEQDGRAYAKDISARFDLTSGTQIDLTASDAILDDGASIATLSGDVTLVSSTGYRIETSELTSSLNELHAESAGEIHGTGPTGTLTAGKMILTGGDTDDSAHLVFTNGVKLIYEPKN